ncbi:MULTISPECIES: SIS domain-containing protein [unclassified Granulicatella]|uniref:SIS domain-containing protein n=1 Tax=unclassified Granulicatella TaxID=2630493 RepID=UPI0010749AB0|nr:MULTISPECIES: SIS domain-containing protein [unclassified Granulicatella]MBF0779960.1 SIS domain-containing protein [Granulicatella sp. 19428wC4_WM01]TFU95976.1 SIS domain-containing protein [Granulicatella sp. WM01]
MFTLQDEALKQQGAYITTREIQQQPELWKETFAIYQDNRQALQTFLDGISVKENQKIRVIFTGAGTSQYVGDTIMPHLMRVGNTTRYIFESIATTNIVSNPHEYLLPDEPTVLVSFARSGNSPESVATVELANQLVNQLYHITITCAENGELAKKAGDDKRNYLLLMPERSNDKGFAMTGSYSCMALSGLLIFDTTDIKEKERYVDTLSVLGASVLNQEETIAELLAPNIDRIVYLGSGSLSGLAREAQLKVLELTAGKIATAFDSSMGFRHGPKSFLSPQTLVFGFVSNQEYTQQYDIDVLNEIHADSIVNNVVAIAQYPLETYQGTVFELGQSSLTLPDGYLAIVDVVVAQTVSLLASIKVGNTPDTPSPSGTVNRVVKGVIIHPLD